MSDLAKSDAQAIIDTAIELSVPDQLDPAQIYSVIIPDGATQHTIDLEKYLQAPRRAQGHVTVGTVDDFERYVTRHDDPESTTIWADLDRRVIVGVLNDHTAEGAAWGDHRVSLALKCTPEWQHWTSRDGQLLSQEDFAEHIEDGLKEIVTPDGATMLEVAQSIQGTVSADFKSAHRLTNGAIGVQYVEEQTATAGARGELEIPERFELAIAPFIGEEAYKVAARLRYRIRNGSLTIGYRLDRPDDVLRDAVDQIANRLHSAFPGDRVFIGAPRS